MKRIARKIRFTPAEWARVCDRANACARPPARYVREVALGSLPRTARGHRHAPVVRELAQIGNALVQLRNECSGAHFDSADDDALRTTLQHTLNELLAAVQRLG